MTYIFATRSHEQNILLFIWPQESITLPVIEISSASSANLCHTKWAREVKFTSSFVHFRCKASVSQKSVQTKILLLNKFRCLCFIVLNVFVEPIKSRTNTLLCLFPHSIESKASLSFCHGYNSEFLWQNWCLLTSCRSPFHRMKKERKHAKCVIFHSNTPTYA